MCHFECRQRCNVTTLIAYTIDGSTFPMVYIGMRPQEVSVPDSEAEAAQREKSPSIHSQRTRT